MNAKIGLVLIVGIASLAAQATPKKFIEQAVYCSGIVTNDAIPYDTYLISGEEADIKITFTWGDYVYLNKGSKQGARVGDQFMVMRPVKAPLRLPWFPEQAELLRAMGTEWIDLGRLQIITVRPDVSIAQVVVSCDLMQRGDDVLPFAERPAPELKAAEKFDRFAPPSGRGAATLVAAKDRRLEMGQGDIVYVSAGSKQGVKIGDYFRIFRYSNEEKMPAYKKGVPGPKQPLQNRKPEELPREILGEGVVLRVTPTSASVLITHSLREIFAGSHAELE